MRRRESPRRACDEPYRVFIRRPGGGTPTPLRTTGPAPPCSSVPWPPANNQPQELRWRPINSRPLYLFPIMVPPLWRLRRCRKMPMLSTARVYETAPYSNANAALILEAVEDAITESLAPVPAAAANARLSSSRRLACTLEKALSIEFRVAGGEGMVRAASRAAAALARASPASTNGGTRVACRVRRCRNRGGRPWCGG